MASGTVAPQTTCEGPPLAPTRYATFIEGRIHYTRRQVKTVDIATGLMVLAAGTLVFLLAVAVLDQWVVVGGLGFSARWLLWLAGVAAAGTYFWRQVLPPVRYSINPIYAAQTIEHNRPSLKNSLINFLLLRGHREEVLPVVYRALEQRAAVDLSQTNIEAAVDRGSVVRRACVLAGIVVAFAIYLALSPKNPLTSAARVLWPWSRIPAPTRVTIEDLRPGDAQAFFGDSVEVSALVSGLSEGEPVTLLASTADGESVDQPIPMSPIGEGNRFQCTLPPGNLGLKQDMLYRLVAGDCNTQPFRIEVQIAPTILIDRVDYRFPRYTGQKDRTVLGQGDLRAIEGTRVTLHATANQEIREAKIDVNCAGLRSLAMTSDGRTATGQFTLGFASDGRPLVDSYQILFSDSQGRTNRRPVRYRVEVIRDLPPEVEILSPKEEEVSVPLDGQVAIGVRAADADFALRHVAVAAEREGRRLPIQPLLSRVRPEEPLQGTFQKEYVFKPAVLGLKAGDRVKYWAEADDNKEPASNHVETPSRTLRVTAPEAPQPPAAGAVPHRAGPKPQDAGDPRQDPQKSTSQQPKPEQGTADQPPQEPGAEKPQPATEKKPEHDEPASTETKKPDASKGPQDAPQNESTAGSPAGPSNSGDSTENQDRQPGSPENQDQQRIDPKTQQGDAIDKMLQHRQKEQIPSQDQQPNQPGQEQPEKNSSGGQSNSPEKQPSSGQKGGAKGQPGGQKSQPKQPGGEKSGNESAGGQSNSPEKQPSSQQGSEKGQPGGQKNQSKQPGGEKAGNESSGGQSNSPEKKPSSQQGGESGQPGGQKNQSKQPGGEKSGNESAGGQSNSPEKKPSGSQQGGENGQPGGQKSENKQPGEQPSEKPGNDPTGGLLQPKTEKDQTPPKSGSKGGESGTPEKKPGDSQPGESQATPGQDSPQKQPSRGASESSSAGTQSDQPRQQDGSKHGDAAPNSQGTPAPQGGNQPGQKSAGNKTPGQPQSSDSASSPGTSPKKSNNNNSDAAGDRTANGSEGGGKEGHNPGRGNPGSNTPSDDGGTTASERGPGETGTRPGEQAVKSNNLNGPAKQEKGLGEGQRREAPGAKGPLGKSEQSPNEASDSAATRNEPSSGGQAGSNTSDKPGSRGSGQPTTGGRPGNLADVAGNPDAPDRGEDAANPDFTKKQVDLALEHLSDQLAKEKPGLLKDLGWSREEAQRFLENWKKMMAAAHESGAKGDAARRSLDKALKNLGLRPHGTRVKGGTTTDQIQNLRDAGQFDPPGDWLDALGAYSRTLSGQRRGEK